MFTFAHIITIGNGEVSRIAHFIQAHGNSRLPWPWQRALGPPGAHPQPQGRGNGRGLPGRAALGPAWWLLHTR